VIDPRIDEDALRTERLERLQTAMRAYGLEACLLFSEPNVRYATGAITMPIWSMSTFTRCAVVPADGAPILFEHPNSIHRVEGVDVRPMHAWEFYDDAATHADRFASEALAALRELGVGSGPVAVDRLGTPGFLALQRAGLAASYSPPMQALQVPEQAGAVHVVTRDFVEAAHGRNLRVHAWTINSEQEMRRLLDMGVDGIMTDYPDRLLRVVGQPSKN